MRGPRTAAGLAIIAAMCLAAGCGYALAGRGNALPITIQSIGIPVFVNHSTMPDIDQVLTTAVRNEFQSKGKYRIEPDAPGADAVLSGTVTGVTATPVAFTSAEHLASSYTIAVHASIEFRDTKADKVIWANPAFQVSDQYDVTTSTAANDPNAIFAQDTNALNRLSQRFAREVVASIFEAF
jgi:hypothetical protein